MLQANFPKLTIAVAISTLLLSGCGGSKTVNEPQQESGNTTNHGTVDETRNETPTTTASTEDIDKVITQNARMAYAVHSDSVSTAEALKVKIDTFAAKPAPTDADLTTLKNLWLAAREPYGLSEVLRFREGPIEALKDDGTMGAEGDGPEGRINAWPLGEALIDYVASGEVDGDTGPENATTVSPVTTNIIADSTSVPTIDKATLAGLNEAGDDERNVATGYHAIEFLLWGQDLNEGENSWTLNRDTSGGQRPASDFNTSDGCTSGLDASGAAITQDNSICERRKDYLVAVTELLIDDLTRIKTAWDPAGSDNYYDTFIAGGKTSLAKMLEGMGRLSFGELAGERMNIAIRTDSQEDEHSCFSDNTHRDIVTNAQGVVDTYQGKYTKVNGTVVDGMGIDDLLKQSDSKLAGDMQAALDDTMQKIGLIDAQVTAGNPFDNQIRTIAAGGSQVDRDRVYAAIKALADQTDVIADAIKALAVTTGDLKQDTDEPI